MVLDITGKRPVRSQILRSTYPCFRLFFDALILFHSLGGDGRGDFTLRRVVLLNVSGGSGDGSPSLATTDADYDAKQD